MREITIRLSEEEFAWVKSKGNNFLRHLVQWSIYLDHLAPWGEWK